MYLLRFISVRSNSALSSPLTKQQVAVAGKPSGKSSLGALDVSIYVTIS